MVRADGEEVQNTQYTFKEDLKRRVGVLRGKSLVVGRLDADGEFQHDPRSDPVIRMDQPASGVPNIVVINLPKKRPTEEVYEFRSRRLIKGVLNERGVFVPDVGAWVIDFGDYRYTETAPRVYNLPGVFVEKSPTGK